jgi:hypothetical protein
MSNSSTSSYNNVSGSSNTASNKSTGSNSNQNENAKRIRNATRARFRAEGQPESWWNPHWYYTNQVRRRAKRAENVLKYPSEKLVPRIPFRNLLKRELTGRLAVKFKIGNIAVQLHRAGGRREYMSLANFNSRYGHAWKRIASGSRRLIAPEINSNLQRSQIKVVKFV